MRLLLEIIGWIVAAYGLIHIVDGEPVMMDYIILIIGVIILLFAVPFKYYRLKKKND